MIFLRLILIWTAILSMGLHWTALQSVAWIGMVASYSQDRPLAEAISNTFDGEHPCPLCCAIQDAQAEEKGKQDDPKQEVKSKNEGKVPVALLEDWKLPQFPQAKFEAVRELGHGSSGWNQKVPRPPCV